MSADELDLILANTGSDAISRLEDAIAGERLFWHAVEVRPDDLAIVLAYIAAVRAHNEDRAERVGMYWERQAAS